MPLYFGLHCFNNPQLHHHTTVMTTTPPLHLTVYDAHFPQRTALVKKLIELGYCVTVYVTTLTEELKQFCNNPLVQLRFSRPDVSNPAKECNGFVDNSIPVELFLGDNLPV